MSVNLYVKSNRGKVEANVQKGGGGQQTDNAVLYTRQFLTDAQKAQARENIGAPGFSDIPQKTSELQNDSGFITAEDIPPVPTKTSELQNDSGFITAEDIPAIPTKTSELQNDSGFITESELAPYAKKTNIQPISDITANIEPESNTIYQCGELTSLTITNPPVTGAWSVVFTSGATATTTSFPATILGLEDFAAEANTMYEINVLDNRAVWMGWPLPDSE